MAKAVFLSGYLTFSGSTIYLTNLDFSEDWNLVDTTDLDTTLGLSEWLADKKRMDFSAEAWKDINTAIPVGGVVAACVLDFEGYQLSGNALIGTVAINAVFDAAVKMAINGTFTGSVTETVAT